MSKRRSITSAVPQSEIAIRDKPRQLFRIKIISMGDSQVGKSCIIKRFCEEKFVGKYISTIGIDYGVKPVTVCNEQVRVNFWDLSGQIEFFQVRNEFYRDTQGSMLVFDITSRSSFDALDKWIQESKDCGAGSVPCILCGNKADKAHQRTVFEEEARLYAEKRGMKYFEISACTGQYVKEAFTTLFQMVYKKITA